MSLKIVHVGGGSVSWAPNLLGSMLGKPALDGSTLVLHDLDPAALELVASVALRCVEHCGAGIDVQTTLDQEEALDGADYVAITIAAGGLAAMRADLEIPERYGIMQTVGDTTGPGGLLRALRNIPVFLQIAHAMEELCPEAWMINFSNPLGAITGAVCAHSSIRAIGSCHGVIGTAGSFARALGVGLEECAWVNTGIDHCSWFTDFATPDGEALHLLIGRGLDEWLSLPPDQAEQDETFGGLYPLRVGLMLGRQLGALPAIADRHMTEFLPGYLWGGESVARWGLRRTTVQERVAGRDAARARLEQMLAGEADLPVAADRGEGRPGQRDDVGGWIMGLEGMCSLDTNVNVTNRGQVPQLPEGAVVETRGVIDGAGVHPLTSPMPPQLAAIVAPHALRELLIVEAAVTGSYDQALAASACDLLLPSADLARPMLDEMLAANERWLPQFGD